MKNFTLRIPPSIRFLFFVYLAGLLLFTLPRVLIFLSRWNETSQLPLFILLQSVWMGFRFDTVISGYFLALPLVSFFVLSFFSTTRPFVHKTIVLFLFILYSAGFFITAADIPYFNQFNSRLTIMALTWADNPAFVGKMILTEARYIIYLLVFIIQSVFFYLFLQKIKNNLTVPQEGKPSARIFIFVFACALLFLAIRGRVGFKSPIRWGTAYFSTYALANQAGLNPVYTFLQSWLDSLDPKNSSVNYMEDENAIRYSQQFLNITPSAKLQSPVAREVNPAQQMQNYNLIVVIMESMSAQKMGWFGNRDNLTPHLDSISKISLTFNNFYSAGIHTFNGVYSTLFGMPGILHKHTMKGVESQQPFSGIAKILSEKNYLTSFFMTHDEQFDNIGGFVTANGFSDIISEEDYSSEKVLSTLGVPDHVMFEESVRYMNKLHGQNKPFFAAFLTGSDHGPYIIPDDIPFAPRSKELKKQIVEYADWSIGRFLSLCRNQAWANSTIFIFTSDHGASMNPVYDMDLSYHHIPFIVHAPGIIAPGQSENIGGQIDIPATALGLLNTSYINNMLGIDLLRENRPYIYFCKDEFAGGLNNEFFYVLRKEGNPSLYLYKKRDTKDHLQNHISLADSMKTYMQAMLQTAQWMIKNKKVN